MTSPLNNLTDTWNNGATVFTGLKYNITNTASAAGSKLFDFQVGGTSKFNFDMHGGLLTLLDTDFSGATGSISGGSSRLDLYIGSGSTRVFVIQNNDVKIGSDATYSFSSASDPAGASSDASFARDAANILAQRRSTNAQTFRVYNTYTDSSNYERGVFDWTTTSNVLTIGTQSAGTGTVRGVLIGNLAGNRLELQSGANPLKYTGAAVTAGDLLHWFIDGNGVTPLAMYAGGSSVFGTTSALSTSATDGFIYIPTCAGAPSGTPRSFTGHVPMVYDTTNHKFYIYDGSWKGGTNPGVFT